MRHLPKPHEGIAGIDRTGDPLMTEAGSLVAAEVTGMLYSAVLVGNPAPKVAEMYTRMSNPRVGDAVVIFDAIYRKDEDGKFKGVGYLVAEREEWWHTDEEWEQVKLEDDSLTDEDRYVEPHAAYVQYGPEPDWVCRWVNCTVLALPRVAR